MGDPFSFTNCWIKQNEDFSKDDYERIYKLIRGVMQSRGPLTFDP